MPKGIPGRAPCSVSGCDRVSHARGLCQLHYDRKYRVRVCSVEGCDNPGRHRNGWCRTHYFRWKDHGSLEKPAPKRKGEFCSVEDCDAPYYIHGFCRNHAYRLTRYDDPLGRPVRLSEEERFLSKVEIRSNGCAQWLGSFGPGSYGSFKTANGETVRAHRWAYERWVGPIPEGFHIHHLCGNRACVETIHLEPLDPSSHMKLHNPKMERR